MDPMANSGPSSCCVPPPIFTGKENYMHWQKKMETFFISQDLWEVIQSVHKIITYQDKRKDAQALYYIQQSVAPPIFSKIISASSAKTAWDILESEYNMAKAHFLEGIYFDAIEISAQLEISCPAGFIKEVPRFLRDVNPAAFTPELISIGPLHHGRPELANMEKHKFHYANSLLQRLGAEKEECVRFVKEREQSIRACYSKPSDLRSKDYVEMILLDLFFIIELFHRTKNKTDTKYPDDYLLHDPRFSNSIKLDLSLVENQLPFPILFELVMFMSKIDNILRHRFMDSIFNYFQYFASYEDLKAEAERYKDYLLLNYLVRGFICRKRTLEVGYWNVLWILSAKKLTKSKVEFCGFVDGSDNIEVCFKKRLLTLQIFTVDKTTERKYSNLMALEKMQFKNEPYIYSYIWLLHSLMKTSDDVAVLVEAGVIINMLDSNQAVVDVLEKLCKNFRFEDIQKVFCFRRLCQKMDDYCSSSSAWWNYCMKILEDVYFTDVWKGTATIAAVILLLLTLTQTVTSILQVTNGSDNNNNCTSTTN